MRYLAIVTRDRRFTLARFPDCPGCQTFVGRAAAIGRAAREALEGWLEAELLAGRAPPRPSARVRRTPGARLLPVAPSPRLALAVQLRWARRDAGLTQEELARRLGVSQQQVAKVERPDANLTLATLLRVAGALGLEIRAEPPEASPRGVAV
ncbi:MAG TPA: helix-turn-helix transcriptional regulator [Anaeromyxobacteraceae bacterium]|nr:helix-turn-helix transcriptional regulator [Anaeromyxobacteraceae bacterium]